LTTGKKGAVGQEKIDRKALPARTGRLYNQPARRRSSMEPKKRPVERLTCFLLAGHLRKSTVVFFPTQSSFLQVNDFYLSIKNLR
jgi:hypothetical protein